MNKMFVVSEKKEINTEEKSVVAWANRPVVDRDGELVAHDCNWIMDSFKKNSVLLMGHNYSIPSVGRVLWWKQTPDGMKFKAQFANTPMGNELWELYKSNMMNAFSIGFIPKEWDDHETTDSKMPRRTYKSIELLEISCVTVPSCSAAVIDAEEKGLIKTKDLSDAIHEIKMIKTQESSNGIKEEITEKAQETEADSGTISSTQEKEVEDSFIELITDTPEVKSEDNYCTCEESEYDNDTCKACGGKRKPKKEAKAPQCQCTECEYSCAPEDGKCDMNCPECGASMSMGSDDSDEDDIEQDACKPKKPKKDININELGYTISDEEVESLVEQFEKMLDEPQDIYFEFDVDVNKKYLFEDCMLKIKQSTEDQIKNKDFDIASQPSIPSSKVLEIFCKFLGCKVKNIYKSDFMIPWTLAGSYLAGFKAICSQFTYKDTRNYNSYGTEYPPTYEVIKINSKTEDDFLVEGADFYSVNGSPIVCSFWQGREGIYTSIYSSRTNKDINKSVISSVHKWVEEKNPLKGEKFSLNKEFFDIDDRDNWNTLIADNSIEKSMKSAEKLIKEKEFNGRGILMLGPPGCLDKNTSVYYRRGKRNSGRWISLENLYKKFNGINNKEWDLLQPTYLQSYTQDGKVIWNKLVAVFDSGYKECVRLETENGHFIVGTPDHPIMDENGHFKMLEEFKPGDFVLQRGSMKPQKGNGKEIKNRPKRRIIWTCKYHPVLAKHKQIENGIEYFYNRIPFARAVFEANMNNLSIDDYLDILKNDELTSSKLKVLPANFDVHHLNENTLDDRLENLIAITHEEHARIHGQIGNFDVEYTTRAKVIGVERFGNCHTYDIQMEDPNNNFVTDGLFFAHNTGKTKSSRILMTQCKDQTFIWVSSKDLTHTWYPEEKIALGFKLARSLAPSILLLEDIDNWIDGKITDMMKTELDGLKKNKNVITILTTNNPEKLPNTLIDRPGRFHDVLNFDHPNKSTRERMLKEWLDIENEDLITQTEGFSGAYMWELIEFAKSIAEDEEISIEEALIQSLEKINSQKELIRNIKKETKSVESAGPISIEELEDASNGYTDSFIEIEVKEAEQEDEFDFDKALSIVEKSLDKVINTKYIDVDDLVYESLMKAKGKMFY